MITRRAFLRQAGLGLAGLGLGLRARAAEPAKRPNFIFFITDDISADDLGCYGNRFIKTPNLDAMAAEGMLFTNACLTISSCSPSRCSIITGRYPHNTGAPELHTPLPTDQHAFPEALRSAGYYTVLSGKNHMGDVKRAFDKISPGRGPGREEDWVAILQNRPKDRPFFFWFASVDAHRDWEFNDKAPRYEPGEIAVPPYLHDGPLTREDLASYYHEISRTDYYAGQLRAELERQGIAENTWFVYCSDNGRPFPRCKTRLYDSGVRSPLIFWAPGRIKPARTDALVSSIDFAPTFLELAGAAKSPRLQGVSLTPILSDPGASVRDFAFSEHNWHVYQAHERSVRHKNWLYIRNAWPERMNRCVESDDHYPAGQELWQREREGALRSEQRDIFLQPRPAEELYDIAADPHQLKNLALSEEHRPLLDFLRRVLDRWTEQTGDSVQANPTGDRREPPAGPGQAAAPRKPGHGEFPGASRNATAIHHPGPIRERDVR